jgi:hypothetical protein
MAHHTSTGDSWSVSRLEIKDGRSGGQLDNQLAIRLEFRDCQLMD